MLVRAAAAPHMPADGVRVVDCFDDSARRDAVGRAGASRPLLGWRSEGETSDPRAVVIVIGASADPRAFAAPCWSHSRTAGPRLPADLLHRFLSNRWGAAGTGAGGHRDLRAEAAVLFFRPQGLFPHALDDQTRRPAVGAADRRGARTVAGGPAHRVYVGSSVA